MPDDKLRICILGTAYPYKGGIAAFNERMAKELISKGHEVEIITFTLQYPSYFYPGKSQYSDEDPPECLSITRSLNSINPISWWSTGSKIRKRKYDLIITRFWIPVVGVSLAKTIQLAKRNDQPIAISVIDNIIPHESRPGDNYFTRMFMSSINGAFTISRSVAEETKRLFPNVPISFYPHPIYDIYGELIEKSEAKKILQLPASKKYILFFGYIRDYKGLDWLLESFALVKDDIPDVDILVAGEYYSDRTKYTSLIETLGIEQRIHMHTDFISTDKVNVYFSACDLVAQTYKSATQSGISQIAIDFRLPMLSTNVGGLSEIVEPGINGIIVDPEIDQIGKGMIDFFIDPDKYYDPSLCEEIKKKYSWSVFIDKLLDLYQKLKISYYQIDN